MAISDLTTALLLNAVIIIQIIFLCIMLCLSIAGMNAKPQIQGRETQELKINGNQGNIEGNDDTHNDDSAYTPTNTTTNPGSSIGLIRKNEPKTIRVRVSKSRKRVNDSAKEKLKWILIGNIVCYLTALLLGVVYIYLLLFTEIQYRLMSIIGTYIYGFGRILMIALFMLRLYTVYCNTVYKIKPKFIVKILVILFIAFGCYIAGQILTLLYFGEDDDKPTHIIIIVGILNIGYVLVDISVNIYLIYTFCQKLFDLLSNTIRISENMIFDKFSMKLLHLTTKLTILVIVSSISTVISLGLVPVATIIKNTNIKLNIVWILIGMDCCINTFCVYLGLKIGNNAYFKRNHIFLFILD